MFLEVDYREKAIIQLLNQQGVEFKEKNLLIGDIHITRRNDSINTTATNTDVATTDTTTDTTAATTDTTAATDNSELPVLIIERKTLSDLAASIVDKRYTEQSYRLSSSKVPNHNIIYLIEGNLASFKSKTRITRDVLESALISLTFSKGFTVVKTNSPEETVNYLLKLYNKVNQPSKFSFYYDVENTVRDISNNSENVLPKGSSSGYLDTLKVSKKNNITQENIQPLMLSQIPGVSVSIATVIINKYETIDKLITSIRENKDEFRNLKVKDSNGKERRISKTALDNICCYLRI